jgi:hypothetical protein
MKKLMVSVPLILSLLGGLAPAQNSNPQIPQGAQVDKPDSPSQGMQPMPEAQPTPVSIPGGVVSAWKWLSEF